MGITAHTFVTEVVAQRLDAEATDLEKMCEIAVLDVLCGTVSANEARRAVLATHAAMAWYAAEQKAAGL